MSLEATTGSTDETCMEYGSLVQDYVPGLKVCVEIADHAESGRGTWLAIIPDGPRDLLMHRGGSASYVLSSREEIRYRSRPESFLAPVLVDTGDLDTRSAFPLGLEFAAARGPLTRQAEHLAALVDANDLGDPTFGGMYASASWFLTGEQRPYDFTTGEFGRLVPTRAVSWRHGGWGAWEIAGRLSYLDLSDADIGGGRMLIGTAGLTWYWKRYLRLLFNTNLAQFQDGVEDGTRAIFQMRTQSVF
jgi:phosphate-selective porin OprO/OprP